MIHVEDDFIKLVRELVDAINAEGKTYAKRNDKLTDDERTNILHEYMPAANKVIKITLIVDDALREIEKKINL